MLKLSVAFAVALYFAAMTYFFVIQRSLLYYPSHSSKLPADANARRMEAVGIARDVDVAERSGRLCVCASRQHERQPGDDQARHFVPQVLRRPSTSEK